MTIEIHGVCDERFGPLKAAFRANFEAGHELGASIAATHKGRTVVELWAGWADTARTRPWARDTIVHVASSTKLATTLALLMQVGRGLIDLDAPIARYWPEFAQGGKADVTVRDLFTHQAGVPGLRPSVPGELASDWEGVTARIAAEPHWFEGRRLLTYHSSTYGFTAGELIRRTDGRMPRVFIHEEIAAKVGADFQVGLSDRADLARLAELHWPPPKSLPESKVTAASFMSFQPRADVASWTALSTDNPGSNGISTGLGLARLGAIIAGRGELDGTRFIPGALIDEMLREQVYAHEPFFGPMRWGLGVNLDHVWFPAPTPTCAHWGGVGGSLAYFDVPTGVAVGYVPNDWSAQSLTGDPRFEALNAALGNVLRSL